MYGLRKRGQSEHGVLEDARFLGSCRTQDPFPLVLVGPERRPLMLSDRGSGHRVTGELYEVTPETLAAIDREVQREDTAFRVMIPVVPADGDPPEAAWVFVRDPESDIEIHGPPLDEFTAGAQYVE